ncbi:hypothetical protein PFICI_03218 [Pestalotiopsis fici W106-1]|uniref:Aldehyde dehydrogenase domain-containing protein n=1 Tax=Pestalotiopsis fici (strain W106-1 / CGMCC3.15140) TaxID=1229662 RepID=W3XGH6_PESFW|nr:uncharacterized protein PFICI_03218 [Pestalotiopsis fici W106-1]ETS85193.1 hypothetical protein PFICI_03218 [Pestalotiopsis fici W106-1]
MGNMEQATVVQEVLERIDAAAIDGRAHNIRHRQHQLHQLSGALQRNADKICEAIGLDSGFDDDEVAFEFSQSINTIRTLYEQLNLQSALDEEYAANNKDNLSARMPFGIVVIRPGQHCRLFSIISPVATAIAAGNCVIVEIPNSLGHLDSFLRSELTTSLDPDGFAIVSKAVTVSRLSSDYVVVDQTLSDTTKESSLVSDSKALTVAIVDRTADVEQAASAICTARFRFKGRSPYAPDVIMVNEWVRDDFVSACLKLSSSHAASTVSAKKSGSALNGRTSHYPRDDFTVLFDSCGVRLVEGTRK